jgi:hypothetical protein
MAVPIGYEYVAYIAITIYAIISGILVIYNLTNKRERTKRFPLLFLSNFGLFIALILIAPHYWNFGDGIDFMAFIAYSVLGSYIATIEIPGYLLLSRFDDKLSDDLQNIRKGIIMLNYDSKDFNDLESRINSMTVRLKDLSLNDIVEHFVASFKRMQQIDKTLYDITLKELGENIQHILSRSKHPFPNLIEILSLAGMSFLIGQFLNHFLP